VGQLGYSPDGRFLLAETGVVEGRLSEIVLWDLTRRVAAQRIPGGKFALSPGGNLLAVVTTARRLQLWTLDPFGEAAAPNEAATMAFAWSTPAFSSNGNRLAATDRSGNVHVWTVADWREQTRLKVQPIPSWVLFTHDGETLLSEAGKRVLQWRLANGQQIGSFDGQTANVSSAALSSNGLLLATGSIDNTARVWDLASHRLIAAFACGAGQINSVAFSRDGKSLAAGTYEGPIQLWNVAARQQSATLRGHLSYIGSLAFSSDGRTLASSSMDKTIRLWQAPPFDETHRVSGAAR